MPVIRSPKRRDFTVVGNAYLKDKTLSLRAKGLLTMMLMLPAGWNYSARGLTALLPEGRDAVLLVLNELELAGYLQRYQPRTESGRLGKMEYLIRDKVG
ncbi:MAG: hypothetical protein LBR72_03835 [Oscillospiraceae bacterium]|jgi:hypothetical protein|nr:hypothetical protein [Oscillospiraceae bacterium]